MFLSNLVMASATEITYTEDSLVRSNIPIESNEIEGWPDGPICYAESAILMEASTGTILYEKNAHQKHANPCKSVFYHF